MLHGVEALRLLTVTESDGANTTHTFTLERKGQRQLENELGREEVDRGGGGEGESTCATRMRTWL